MCRHNDLFIQCVSQKLYCCHAESINVRLTDGPGKCAGRVEIEYDGTWQRVKDKDWTDINTEKVCKQLKCGKKSPNSDKFSQGTGPMLLPSVNCQQDANDISECLKDGASSQSATDTAVGVTCSSECFLITKDKHFFPC